MKEVNFETVSFGIITYAGNAKSNAILAIRAAKENNFTEAQELIDKAEKDHAEAHKFHIDLIQQEAAGVKHQIPILFMHAEDIMMSAQLVIDLAKEIIDIYQKIVETR